jgi:chloramphenicol O-acetyltransferase type B
MIMPGLTLGEGAIVAAHAVVTKDVEPYTLVAGNPARAVRKRFDEDVIQRILQLNIYSWSDDKFNAVKDYICNNDIEALEQASKAYDSFSI